MSDTVDDQAEPPASYDTHYGNYDRYMEAMDDAAFDHYVAIVEADQNAVRQDYEAVRPLYEQWTKRVAALLQVMLEEEIEGLAISARAKTVESFMDKVFERDKNYDDPLTEVTDLAGVRIVVQLLTDVEQVATVLRHEFEVDPTHSVDKSKQLKPNQFGYLSKHYVVRLKEPRINQPEWKKFADFGVEVQVRTVLQDAWAKVDHWLRYKPARKKLPSSPLPDDLKRRLFTVAAGLELADRELTTIIQQRDERESVGSMRQPTMDEATLTAFLTSSPLASYWVDVLTELGAKIVEADWISRDLDILNAAGICTSAQLDAELEHAKSKGSTLLQNVFGIDEGVEKPINVPRTAIVSVFVVANHLDDFIFNRIEEDEARTFRSVIRRVIKAKEKLSWPQFNSSEDDDIPF
jgi:putative GTP pyrophosphokinase